MAVILRLQGLDVKAGTEDIRAFFQCLHIPDGGVYIVGGSLCEAFIAFSTDRDAQFAMRFSGRFLKGSKVTLHISNMKELEHKLKSLLKRRKPSPRQHPEVSPQQSPDATLASGPRTTNVRPTAASTHDPRTENAPNVRPTAASTHDPRIENNPDVQPSAASTHDPRIENNPDVQPSAASTHDPRIENNPHVQPSAASTHDPRIENTPDARPSVSSPRDPRIANLPQLLHPDISNLQPSAAIDSSTAFILGMCTVLHGLQSSHQRENNEPVPRVDFLKSISTVVSNEARTPEQTPNSKPGYVRLFGLPASTTKEAICHFFRGLTVQEAIVNVELGPGHGCLVKFASEQEACDALLFNQQSLGPICVEVRGATEKMWTGALQECENTSEVGESVKLKKSPLRETANHRQKSPALQMKRQSVNRFPSKSPKKPKLNGDTTALSSTEEYTVMVNNLPKTMTKTEIKELLRCPNIAHKNVLHLLDKEGNRTDTAFVIFNRTDDYDYAINLNGCHVGSGAIEVSAITKVMMRDMMAKTHPRRIEPDTKKRPNRKRKSHPAEAPEEAPRISVDTAAQTCLFVRNMPADVAKNQIKSLFCNYRLENDNIILLLDSNGEGTGEAVVQFKSQKLAALAQRLHGQDFLGSKLLLTRISVKQMEGILARSA